MNSIIESTESHRADTTIAGVRQKYSICIVATELARLYKNGGIGTSNWLLANYLASNGWDVHILYCGAAGYRHSVYLDVERQLQRVGCSIATMSGINSSPFLRFLGGNAKAVLDLSARVRDRLEALDRIHHFDLIEFADYQGIGYSSIQSKMTGKAFGTSQMLVRLHGSSQWTREANQRRMRHRNDQLLDQAERYSFEHADQQLSPSHFMLEYAKQIGWLTNYSAEVVRYIYPEPSSLVRLTKVPDEVVFFGRLETRKGLELFVDAVQELDEKITITFLGKNTTLSNGSSAVRWIKRLLPHRKIKFLTALEQREAIEYLKDGNKLAVIPSLIDNFPNTAIECAVHGIPFLAARSGGIPELLPDLHLQSTLLFDTNALDLLSQLQSFLARPIADLQQIQQRVYEVVQPAANNEEVTRQYALIAQRERERARR